jgi:cytochrome c biogenesis protein CcmG/thiol:disulfide interchange protein DsbE
MANNSMANKSSKKRYYFIILPILVIGSIFFVLYSGVSFNPYGTTVTEMNKRLPHLRATDLFQWNNIIDTREFRKANLGHWYLINVWASWCDTCLNEQPFLMDLARDGVTIYGVNDSDSAVSAKKWLVSYGNPYVEIMWDARSIVSTALGVTSVPTTYLIDPYGYIRFKVTGLLSIDIWKNQILPLIEKNTPNDKAGQ